jgi:CheY-like chemotaxis protein
MSAEQLTRILYVEDDESIQLIAQLALQDVGGFEVQICSSGQDALHAVEAFTPDLLLLDVMMPGMDGPTTLQHLREITTTRDTPAIFMTAKAQAHEISELQQHQNTIGVITKPFDPMTLATQIRDAWKNYISSM